MARIDRTPFGNSSVRTFPSRTHCRASGFSSAIQTSPDRPINTDAERAEVLASLASVDAVVVFDEETPHQIIELLQPDILVKGADWGENEIVGRDVVEARGGKVVRIPLAEGYSTTRLIEKVRNLS